MSNKQDLKKGDISIFNGKLFRVQSGGTRNRFISDLNRFIRTRGGGDFHGFLNFVLFF